MKFTTNKDKSKLKEKKKKKEEEEKSFKQMCKEFDELIASWDAAYKK